MSARTTHGLRLAFLAATALSLAAAGCATVPAVIFASMAGAQDKVSLDGSWEIQFGSTGTGVWSDPASPVAQRIQFWGNPMGGDPGNGMRTFASFNEKNVFVETFSYDQSTNKIYVDTPQGNPFMGKTLLEQPDGTFTVDSTQDQPTDNNNPFSAQVRFTLVLGPNDSGGWSGQLSFTFTFTAIAAVSEDVPNNLPAINPGETATYSWHWDLSLTPSDPPVVLFPDAEWELSGD